MTPRARLTGPRSGGPAAPLTVEDAERDVQTARSVVIALRTRVAQGLDGAGSLAAAEYRLHVALRQLDRARQAVPVPDPPDAA